MMYVLAVIAGILIVLGGITTLIIFALWCSDGCEGIGFGISALIGFIVMILLGILEYNITNLKLYIDNLYTQKVKAVKQAEVDLQKFLIDYPEYKEKSDNVQEIMGDSKK